MFDSSIIENPAIVDSEIANLECWRHRHGPLRFADPATRPLCGVFTDHRTDNRGTTVDSTINTATLASTFLEKCVQERQGCITSDQAICYDRTASGATIDSAAQGRTIPDNITAVDCRATGKAGNSTRPHPRAYVIPDTVDNSESLKHAIRSFTIK